MILLAAIATICLLLRLLDCFPVGPAVLEVSRNTVPDRIWREIEFSGDLRRNPAMDLAEVDALDPGGMGSLQIRCFVLH